MWGAITDIRYPSSLRLSGARILKLRETLHFKTLTNVKSQTWQVLIITALQLITPISSLLASGAGAIFLVFYFIPDLLRVAAREMDGDPPLMSRGPGCLSWWWQSSTFRECELWNITVNTHFRSRCSCVSTWDTAPEHFFFNYLCPSSRHGPRCQE